MRLLLAGQPFAGERPLHSGRGDVTYEVPARLGAAGAIIGHTDASAGYGWPLVRRKALAELGR